LGDALEKIKGVYFDALHENNIESHIKGHLIHIILLKIPNIYFVTIYKIRTFKRVLSTIKKKVLKKIS